jgi:hypothetical protein
LSFSTLKYRTRVLLGSLLAVVRNERAIDSELGHELEREPPDLLRGGSSVLLLELSPGLVPLAPFGPATVQSTVEALGQENGERVDVDVLTLEPLSEFLLLREDVVLLERLGWKHARERVLPLREWLAKLPVVPGDFEDGLYV